MASIPMEVRLSYAAPSPFGGGAFVWAFHERRGSYQAPPIAAGRSSGSITPRGHAPAAVSAPVGLHLEPGQTGNPDRTMWQLGYDRVVALGLRRRIVTPRHPVLDAAASGEKHPDADAGRASI